MHPQQPGKRAFGLLAIVSGLTALAMAFFLGPDVFALSPKSPLAATVLAILTSTCVLSIYAASSNTKAKVIAEVTLGLILLAVGGVTVAWLVYGDTVKGTQSWWLMLSAAGLVFLIGLLRFTTTCLDWFNRRPDKT